MAIKSAYREKIPAVETSAPDVPERVSPSESVKIDFDTNKAEPSPSVAIVSADEFPEPNEAGEALKRQLQHLRDSEEALRQHHAATLAARAAMAQQQQAQPPTREQKLAMWKEQGMDDEEGRFLSENPELIDRADITSQAAAAALHAGLERGTQEFNNAVKVNFDAMLGRIEAQARPASTPAFFQPPEPSRSPAAPGPAAYVSAPVSRRDAGGYREPSPRSVRLTGEEFAIAAASGISDVEYARHKLRLLRAKAAGEIQ